MSDEGHGYTEVASRQLDALEEGPDMDLYNAVLDACDLVFQAPARAQAHSSAVATREGVVLRLPVVGHPPYKVFWLPDGPVIRAIFPHP